MLKIYRVESRNGQGMYDYEPSKPVSRSMNDEMIHPCHAKELKKLKKLIRLHPDFALQFATAYRDNNEL